MTKTGEGATQAVTILYTNHRGETTLRRISPYEIRWCATERHPEAQWVLEAYDYEKDDDRTFAMKDIRAWIVD